MVKRENIVRDGVPYLHIESAARLLNCSAQYIRAETNSGRLLGRKFGGAWYVDEGSLVAHTSNRQAKVLHKGIAAAERTKEAAKSFTDKVAHSRRIVGKEIKRGR